MSQPHGFSWIEKPLLAAMARPESLEEMQWLRQQGLEVLLSLTEDPPPRSWINEAGLMLVHVPVTDMQPPSQEQIESCIVTVERAHVQGIGVGIHCGAGLGRTGVILACFLVATGFSPKNAVARVRRLRPGSIETREQEEAVSEYARLRPR